ncbi:MAG: hypothetical protein K2L17_10580, partial [Muribaculaceae bacterium]|nr:hypothetical protein [Muribaculaceae bacterium]
VIRGNKSAKESFLQTNCKYYSILSRFFINISKKNSLKMRIFQRFYIILQSNLGISWKEILISKVNTD